MSYLRAAFQRIFQSSPGAVAAAEMVNPTKFVQDKIAESAQGVVVFSKTYCPYCARVKKLFKDLGVNADVVELDTMDDGSAIQAALQQITGQRTVPNVFVKGKHIGGCDDTVAAQKAGTLGL